MANSRVKRTAVATTALGASAALILVGCSSGSSSSSTSASSAPEPTKTSEAPKPSGAVPAPPAGAKQLSTQAEAGNTKYTRYQTSQPPTSVTAYYKSEMSKGGWKVTGSSSGGGGWGQYGGSGSQVEGNDGSTFVAVNAGGSKQGATYFEVCSGPSSSAVDDCQDNDHGDDNGNSDSS